jgi:hypothetical protein
VNRHQRRAKAAVSRAAGLARPTDRRRDGTEPGAPEGHKATPTSPNPTGMIRAPEGGGIGRSATDPPQPDQQQETQTLSDLPSNNLIKSLVETPPPPTLRPSEVNPSSPRRSSLRPTGRLRVRFAPATSGPNLSRREGSAPAATDRPRRPTRPSPPRGRPRTRSTPPTSDCRRTSSAPEV